MAEVKEEEQLGLFGMEKEFQYIAPVQESMLQPEVAKPYIKEVQIGNEIKTFEGKDAEEVMDKILAAKDEFYRAQAFTPQYQPEEDFEPVVVDQMPAATADDLASIMLQMQTDPVGAQRRLNEFAFGRPFDQILQGLDTAQNVHNLIYLEKAETDFVMRHKADFYPCPENRDNMYKFLEAKGLEPSPQNFDYALSNLKSLNVLKTAPVADPKRDEVKNAPTALSARESTYVPQMTAGQSDEEIIKRARTMPLDQLEAELRSRSRR